MHAWHALQQQGGQRVRADSAMTMACVSAVVNSGTSLVKRCSICVSAFASVRLCVFVYVHVYICMCITILNILA